MIFDERINLKPSEYPECEKFADAINHSYWLIEEWNFNQDVHEFNQVLTPEEREMAQNSMLAVSQIEVALKTFWIDLVKRLPKPEIGMVGSTFSESEVRHMRSYQKLLELAGLDEKFETLLEVPCLKGRIAYLRKYKEFMAEGDKRNFLKALVLFSLFVENVSLFSQFFILAGFKKYKNLLKDVCQVVTATSKEEAIHAEFGIYLINQIKREFPDLWDGNMERAIVAFAEKAYEAECDVIDWIMPKNTFIKRGLVKDFLKDRFNKSLNKIGISNVFQVRNRSEFQWYYDELQSTIDEDFFNSRPTGYSLKTKPITSNDLF